jgi:type I restriction enzyme R subunit
LPNQNPEQKARDEIDRQLESAGWLVQSMKRINLGAGIGVAIREYPTESGPADYVLFVDSEPVGVIEAKRAEEGHHLSVHEEQTENYAKSKLKYIGEKPLLFLYESTGVLTRFTDKRDPKPRSREIFSFHRPQTLREWLKQDGSLRMRLQSMPRLDEAGLRICQVRAVTNLEKTLQQNHPKSLIQMATGSGKTFTAITAAYRLIKFAKAKRILFLVDTRNLGEQAEQEFFSFTPNDDNRKFTELYSVQRLKSSYIADDSQVCISTIQRLYAILRGKELDDDADEINPNELVQPKQPMPVVYNPKIPPEFFDFVIVDECHRSIYNVWKQVLEYFDSFLIGLTATPDKRTFAFFDENVVSEYPHAEAVADGVNVGYDEYIIETEISKKGARIKAHEFVDKRERLTRKKRWEQLDDDLSYNSGDLDKDVVNKSQIRNILKTYKEQLPEIFPGREETPKTLIFAKSDSHADDIIDIARTVFGEGNQFCKKITYRSDEDPKSILTQFRTDYYPRIAVTVDMIATGTDVRPLECLLFMRDVRSSNYFEQMKGRGTRTFSHDDLKKVTPSAKTAKTHFVIVDAVGVTKSCKTSSYPMERKKSVPLKDLMMAVMLGVKDEDAFTSLAGRLSRLEQELTQAEKSKIESLSGGKSISEIAKSLLMAFDPDAISETAILDNNLQVDEEPTAEQILQAKDKLAAHCASGFTGELIEYVDTIRKVHEQVIDSVNLDRVTFAGWNIDSEAKASSIIEEFQQYSEKYSEELDALKFFYKVDYQHRALSYSMVQQLLEHLKTNKPNLAPVRVWEAYERLDKVKGSSPLSELTALVSLLRRLTGKDKTITTFEATVNKNFQDWTFRKQAGSLKFSSEQMDWLRMLKDHVSTSFSVQKEDLDYAPFNAKGGLAQMHKLFRDSFEETLQELNECAVA